MRQQQSLVYVVSMDTLLPWQQKQVLITLLFITFFHIWCTHSLRQQQSLVLPIAMDTLLSWQQKQVLITLLFEAIQSSYLVQMFLEVFVISFIFVVMEQCYHGNRNNVLVTFIVWRYRNFIFGTHTFWGNTSSWYNLLLMDTFLSAGAYNIAVWRYRNFFFVRTFLRQQHSIE